MASSMACGDIRGTWPRPNCRFGAATVDRVLKRHCFPSPSRRSLVSANWAIYCWPFTLHCHHPLGLVFPADSLHQRMGVYSYHVIHFPTLGMSPTSVTGCLDLQYKSVKSLDFFQRYKEEFGPEGNHHPASLC